MASFINAQRWATGVKTHKTINGDFVVCTGTECLGCFPEDNPGEAEELGICDINTKDYPFRTFLNKDYFEARLEKVWNSKQTNFLHEIRMKTNTRGVYFKDKENNLCEDITDEVTLTKRQDMDGNVSGEELLDNTEFVALNQILFNEKDQPGTPSDSTGTDSKTGTKDNENDDIYKTLQALGIKTEKSGFVENENKHEETKERKLNRLHTKFKISNRCSPVSQNIIGDDLYEEITGTRAKNFLKKMGEDCRCIFFAIQYYGQSRKLPVFRPTEIVEQLCKMIDIHDIKCVQIFYDIWHIVVRSPAAARLLVTKGVVIRGRHYTLVQDSDSYLDIVG